MANLVSLTYTKEFLQITDSTHDDLLNNNLIPSASAIVNEYVGQTLSSASYTENYNLRYSTKILNLNVLPVTALTEVVIFPNETYAETFDGGLFNLDNDSGAIQFKSTASRSIFPAGFQNVEVSYTAGYSTIPDDVQQATAMVISNFFNLSGKSLDLQQEKLGDWQKSFAVTSRREMAKGIDVGVKALLAPYRRIRIA